MQQRAKRFVLVGCGALLATAILLLWPREPAYGGKTLSEWVILLGHQPWPPRHTIAEVAITRIGPPALPYLTKWIQHRKPTAKQRILNAINQVRLRLWPIRRVAFTVTISGTRQLDEQDARGFGAAKAFCLIAGQATNALTELGQLACSTATPSQPNFETSIRACYGLRDFGAEGVPYLLELVTNHQHFFAAQSFGSMGTNAFPAIPVLIQSLRSTDRFLPGNAAEALGNLHHDPNLVLPALTACLTNTNSFTRICAIRALAHFDTNALPVARRIREMLADPDGDVRSEAIHFLRRIAPETLAKAPAQ